MRSRRRAAPDGGAAELELFAPPVEAVPPPVLAPRIEETIPGASPTSAVSIATLTRTAKDVVEGAFLPLWVRGEVSDFKAHRNGHWYFCLRDAEAQLRCVVWSRDRRRIPAPPDDGMQVVALGQLTVYAARGEMQFTVARMEAEGDGLWRKALDLTRARLEADGLLDPARKRALPRFPRRVAVITSRDGAALRDIVSVVSRRCPVVEVVLIPASVQGESAPESLCYALDQVARWRDADLLIIGRGGGSREDLWAFNDERVARALAACPIPTISAVGHEIDMSICDLVADLRAATPSAAAEAAVPVLAEERDRARSLAAALTRFGAEHLARARRRGEDSARAVVEGARRAVERRRMRAEAVAGRLHALSPLATLRRGYAIARDADGRMVRSAGGLAPGDELELRFHDGLAHAQVTTVDYPGGDPRATPRPAPGIDQDRE